MALPHPYHYDLVASENMYCQGLQVGANVLTSLFSRSIKLKVYRGDPGQGVNGKLEELKEIASVTIRARATSLSALPIEGI